MRVGIIAPQGWTGEYDGWDASRAWARTVALAHQTETLGFDSIWLFDHVQTEPVPTDVTIVLSYEDATAMALCFQERSGRSGPIIGVLVNP